MTRNISLTIIFAFIIFAASAQTKNKEAIRYINKYSKDAIASMKEYGIPASIKLAQGLLESGNGSSELAKKSNNHFGIKCKNTWRGKKVYHDDDAAQECFRKYDSVYDSFCDHSVFLSSSERYASLFRLRTTDYKGWAYGLKKAGYATNPKYPSLLINLIEQYDLHKLDSRKTNKNYVATEDTKPEEIPFPKMVADHITNGISVYRDKKEIYVIAGKTDTFRSLSKALKISRRRLQKYNEDVNTKGDRKIYLTKKRNKIK